MENRKPLKELNIINKIQKNDFEKVVEILYYEGPITSLFEDSKGELFIFNWLDMDDKYHRWLIFKTNKELLSDFINGKISTRKFFTSPIDGKYYVEDINFNDYDFNNRIWNEVELTSDIFIPEEGDYFEKKFLYEPELMEKYI